MWPATTIWPAGPAAPLASSLNWGPGQTIANAVTTGLGAGGAITASTAAGKVHVIADTAGLVRVISLDCRLRHEIWAAEL